jgi:hypothetical protein
MLISSEIETYPIKSEIVGKSDLIRKNTQKLDMMLNLKENWDENSAKPFSKELINKVRLLINKLIEHQPNIFPTLESNIQIEFYNGENSYLQFVVSDNLVESYQTDGLNFENDIFEEFEYSEETIIKKVYDFYTNVFQKDIVVYGQ